MGIDVTVRHTVDSAFPFRFGRYSSAVTSAERAKRAAYAAGRGWVRVPGAVLPVVATTMGTMGPTAWHFFDSVVRERRHGAVVVSDVLAHQHLHRGQETELWARRICVFLRIAVATVALARLRGAIRDDHRRGATVPGWSWARQQQCSLMLRDSCSGLQADGADVDDVLGSTFVARGWGSG